MRLDIGEQTKFERGPAMNCTDVNRAAFEGRLEDLRDLLLTQQQQHPKVKFDEIIDHEDAGRGPLHFSILGRQDLCTLILLEEYNASPFLLDDVSKAWPHFSQPTSL